MTESPGSGFGETPQRLHEREIAVPDEDLVQRLLAAQAGELAALPVRRLRGSGTVNHVFRLGDRYSVRLPRIAWAEDGIDREAALVPRLAPLLPVLLPMPVLLGQPAEGFPFRWSVVEWLSGDHPKPTREAEVDRRFANELADAVLALRAVRPIDGPSAGRPPLADLDADARSSIDRITELDRAALHAAWDRALAAPEWGGAPDWIHTDLLPANLLVAGGRLTGVLDWGAAGVGDRAHDVVPAWSALRTPGRTMLRERLQVEEGEWERARGLGLFQAVAAIPYYRETNPGFAARCVATAREILHDLGSRR